MRNKLTLNDTPTETLAKLEARVKSKIKPNNHATKHDIAAELLLLKLLDMGTTANEATRNAREKIDSLKG